MARKNASQVMEELRRVLEEHAPVSGDQLPPERQMRALLGCSRDTLRTCYLTLEQEGELWRHVGQGTFRGRRPRFMPIKETLLVEGATVPDLMHARLLLEPQVAAEAARQATAQDVAVLRAKNAECRASRDRAEGEQTDDAFHRALAETSGNPVLIGFLVYLSGARRRIAWQREWDRTYRRIPPNEFQTLHSGQHDGIVDAIAAGDAEAAAAAMRTHLETIEAAMVFGQTPTFGPTG